MITRLRVTLFAILSALALAGSGEGVRALAAGTSDTAEVVALRLASGDDAESIRAVQATQQVAAPRLNLRPSVLRFSGAAGDGDSGASRSAHTLFMSVHTAGFAVVWTSIPASLHIVRAAAFARSGGLSFSTTLPPPPLA